MADLDPVHVAKVQAAFSVGWALYRVCLRLGDTDDGSNPWVDLPSLSELAGGEWARFQLEHLDAPLTVLGCDGATPLIAATSTPPVRSVTLPGVRAAWRTGPADAARVAAARSDLGLLYGELLERLTASDPSLGSALVLGRWLAGTCFGPRRSEEVPIGFDRLQLSKIQSVLKDVADKLPDDVAVTVSMSLDRWAAWLDVYGASAEDLTAALQNQGEHWRALLAGEKPPRSLLTPEANAGAVEATAQRVGGIVRRTISQFAGLIAFVLVVGAGLVALSIAYASGTAKVWSSLVSVVGALGVTGVTVKRGASSIASSAAGAVGRMHDIDAMVYVATWLPEPPRGRWPQRVLQNHRMRARGVPPARSY